jgi:4-amino-4-deoxy-L-arabinose transferase-like glycosyltransferase
LALLAPRWRISPDADKRRQFLLSIVIFGLVFFSASLNKLPGYVLPLLPALFVAIGLWYEDRHPADLPRSLVVACTVLIAVVPFITQLLPAILSGPHWWRVPISFRPTLIAFAVVPPGFALLARRAWLGPMAIFACLAAAFYLKEQALPILDRDVSMRVLYQELAPRMSEVCDAGLHRRAQYQFALYIGQPLPLCTTGSFPLRLSQRGNERPAVTEVAVDGSQSTEH